MSTYNTGKVRIGLLYTPTQNNMSSTDAQALQLALLTPDVAKPISQDWIVYAVSFVAIICIFL